MAKECIEKEAAMKAEQMRMDWRREE